MKMLHIINSVSMSLGAKLRKLRLKSGQSLQQIADKVGVSKSHIYDLEIGAVRNPSVEVLRKLSKLLTVPITYFLEENKDLEFQVIFCDLQKDFASLDESDRKTIELMVKVLKDKKNQSTDNEN